MSVSLQAQKVNENMDACNIFFMLMLSMATGVLTAKPGEHLDKDRPHFQTSSVGSLEG
jgi:hypothetical protein